MVITIKLVILLLAIGEKLKKKKISPLIVLSIRDLGFCVAVFTKIVVFLF